MKRLFDIIVLEGDSMSNENILKSRYKDFEIDFSLDAGWYVIKLDGSGFKPFRVPNISKEVLRKYRKIMNCVVKDVINEFKFIKLSFAIDDEFYFLFHTNSFLKDELRGFKITSLLSSFCTCRFNDHLSRVEIMSRYEVNVGKYCFDSRLVELDVEDLKGFFLEKINHGKLFAGNLIVGDGIPFLDKTFPEIIRLGTENNFNIKEDYYLLFGTMFYYGKTINLRNKSFGKYKNTCTGAIKDIVDNSEHFIAETHFKKDKVYRLRT